MQPSKRVVAHNQVFTGNSDAKNRGAFWSWYFAQWLPPKRDNLSFWADSPDPSPISYNQTSIRV